MSNTQYNSVHYDVKTKMNGENYILIGIFSDINWLNILGEDDGENMTLIFRFISKDKNNKEMEINRASNQFLQPIMKNLYNKIKNPISSRNKKCIITDQVDSLNSMSMICTVERCKFIFHNPDKNGEVLISSKNKKLNREDIYIFLNELSKIAISCDYIETKARFLEQYANSSELFEKTK